MEMADAFSSAQWDHTAAILCQTANIHRDRKKTRPFHPSMFHPYHASKRKGNSVEANRWWDAVVAEGKRRQGGMVNPHPEKSNGHHRLKGGA